MGRGVIIEKQPATTPEEVVDALRERVDVLQKERNVYGMLTRALAATCLNASGKGDETALIFTREELLAATALNLDIAPIDDGRIALVLTGLTEALEAQAEAMEGAADTASVDRFDDDAAE